MNIYGPYFSTKELGIMDTTPAEIREKMYLLVKFALNPIRLRYGPTRITSGNRSPEKNASVGGVETSQHITGEAADILCPHANMREVFEWLRTWWPGQVFYYSKKGHVHIALPNISLQLAGRLYAQILDK